MFSSLHIDKNDAVVVDSGEHEALRVIENWKSLAAEKKKRTAKYLGSSQHTIADSLVFEKAKKIPI